MYVPLVSLLDFSPLSQFLDDVGCRMMILCVLFPKAAIDFARDKEREEERRRKRGINSLEKYLENVKIRWAEFRFPREMHVYGALSSGS